MTVLVETKFTNMGTISRVTHILVGKLIIILSAIAAISYSPLIAGFWFAVPMLPAAYLLFTGLTGWNPLVALDNNKSRIHLNTPIKI